MLLDALKLLAIGYLTFLAAGALMGWASLVLMLPVRAFYGYVRLTVAAVTGGRRKLEPFTHRRFLDEIRDWRRDLTFDQDVSTDDWLTEAKDGS